MLSKLFIVFLKIGTFAFGGGYTVLSLIRDMIVIQNSWVQKEAMIDIVALSQMTPGPIAVNCATLIGSKIAGFSGAVIATIGVVIPAVLIVSLLNYLITKHNERRFIKNLLKSLRPASLGLIFAAGFMLFKDNVNKGNVNSVIPYIITLSAGLISYKFRPNPIIIISASALVGIFIF